MKPRTAELQRSRVLRQPDGCSASAGGSAAAAALGFPKAADGGGRETRIINSQGSGGGVAESAIVAVRVIALVTPAGRDGSMGSVRFASATTFG